MTDLAQSMSATSAAKRGRPKKDPATAQARQKLIRSGLIHLTERGYSSVGVDEVLTHAGVPKGSFYHYFRNKEDFGGQLISAYHAYFSAKLHISFSNPKLPALKRLAAFVEDAEAGMARHGFRRGCLVGNLGQEMAALPESFRSQLICVLEDWQARTAKCLRLAQDEGTLSSTQDAKALAAFFWIGWEGAVLRSKLECDAAPLRIFSNSFFTLLTA
ncbi:TetR/AcrR family transcriptional regulator [Roseibium sp.]|uniref:acrylate utilization transcriptional regulator AcuR n=1 Tax=Roseibium sp. TaxID=1936156 RepID=UPI003A972F7E